MSNDGNDRVFFDCYTADQMRQYADDANAALREQVQALQSEVIRATNFELDAGRVMRHEPMLNGFEDLWAIEAERDSLEWRLTNAMIRVKVLEDALRCTVRELQACQSVIHLAGGFDPAYVSDAQVALKAARAALEATR